SDPRGGIAKPITPLARGSAHQSCFCVVYLHTKPQYTLCCKHLGSAMAKTFVGPRLRQLRREHNQTQAEMAKALGVTPGYVNLLENNQRSLSVRLLLALADAYGVDWEDMVRDRTSGLLSELRNIVRDPMFGETAPDIQELRAAIDHAPKLVALLLHLYGV